MSTSAGPAPERSDPSPALSPDRSPRPSPALSSDGSPAPTSAPSSAPTSAPTSAWRRLVRAARPRATKSNAFAALLALALGFAVVTQVQQTRSQPLENLRQPELVGILDALNANATELDDEARELQATRDQLVSGSASGEAALKAAQERLQALGILAGTVAATGPGIRLTITDPDGKLTAPVLLDALEELRDAGAESIQVGTVRVVASSFVAGTGGRLQIDGVGLSSPYRILAIGDAQTLASAMAIPGGIIETVNQLGASAGVSQQESVVIDALHTPRTPRYSRPQPAAK